jgi:hypothetical protein
MQYTGAPSSCQWRRADRAPLRHITIVAALVMAYAAAVVRCSVPAAQSRRVKREAGESALRSIPALPPQR